MQVFVGTEESETPVTTASSGVCLESCHRELWGSEENVCLQTNKNVTMSDSCNLTLLCDIKLYSFKRLDIF